MTTEHEETFFEELFAESIQTDSLLKFRLSVATQRIIHKTFKKEWNDAVIAKNGVKLISEITNEFCKGIFIEDIRTSKKLTSEAMFFLIETVVSVVAIRLTKVVISRLFKKSGEDNAANKIKEFSQKYSKEEWSKKIFPNGEIEEKSSKIEEQIAVTLKKTPPQKQNDDSICGAVNIIASIITIVKEFFSCNWQ